MVEETLDFDLDPPVAIGLSSRHHQGSLLYAIRMLQQHREICNQMLDDPEALLRLLGSDMTWPLSVIAKISVALEGESKVPQEDFDVPKFLRRLKTRSAWRTYEGVVSSMYIDDPKLIMGALENRLHTLITGNTTSSLGNPNIAHLGRLLGLSTTESKIIDFAECRSFSLFRQVLRNICGFSLNDAYDYLATAIGAPLAEVRTALRSNAPLRSYRLIRLDSTPNDMEDFIRLESTGETLLNEDFPDSEDMLRLLVQPGLPGKLEAADFPHMRDDLALLSRYFRNASQTRSAGCNILLYGPPGTGKTEFARLIAKQAELGQFDIKSCDLQGDSMAKHERIAHFALAQRFLAEQGEALLIFDEIEDVFPSDDFGMSFIFGRGKGTRTANQSKAWINNLLETSPVPSIWITNSIESIDEAYLRRFTYHVEFRQAPRQVRSRIVERCLGNLAQDPELITLLSSDDTLSPAQLSQATKFAHLCGDLDEGANHETLIRAVKASQCAAGRSFKTNAAPLISDGCNFRYLNVDSELPVSKIEQAISRRGQGTLCFYGVPGSGKTSLARHLADAIARPLLIKRASDLLGKYVGESEKAIAAMFREAEQTGSVLLLDEADSFLRSREGAQRSWEVTQVNELLQQMENFNGVFICTTNLIDAVDEAALRRFTFKLRFDPLTIAQRQALFVESCFGQQETSLAAEFIHRLERLCNLTPGDFATVRRQEKLLDEHFAPSDFIHQLERECALKTGKQTARIGF